MAESVVERLAELLQSQTGLDRAESVNTAYALVRLVRVIRDEATKPLHVEIERLRKAASRLSSPEVRSAESRPSRADPLSNRVAPSGADSGQFSPVPAFDIRRIYELVTAYGWKNWAEMHAFCPFCCASTSESHNSECPMRRPPTELEAQLALVHEAGRIEGRREARLASPEGTREGRPSAFVASEMDNSYWPVKSSPSSTPAATPAKLESERQKLADLGFGSVETYHSPRVSAATPAPSCPSCKRTHSFYRTAVLLVDGKRMDQWKCECGCEFPIPISALSEHLTRLVSAAERPAQTCDSDIFKAAADYQRALLRVRQLLNARIQSAEVDTRLAQAEGQSSIGREWIAFSHGLEYARRLVQDELDAIAIEPAPPGPVAQEKE